MITRLSDKRASLKRRTEALLFACARPGADLRRDEKSALIKRGVDFEYLFSLAVNHHVSSLTRNALKFHTPSSGCERKAFKDLRIDCLTHSTVNGFYKKELMRILASFAAKAIPVIPLKGILLSEYLYGDSESRDQSVDADLLVREDDVKNSRLALEELGYLFRPDDEIEKYLWSYTFIKPGLPAIDLHWDITMMVRGRERIDGLWQGARIASSSGVKYYYFKPEELLLYLSAHLVNSGAFRQLRHIRDIERLVEKYGNEIDWNSVVRKAREWHLSGSLYAALTLVKEFSGAIFPRKILSGLKISAPKRFFIRFFADKRVVAGSRLRRRLLDAFLSYTLFEIIEARSIEDYLKILKRVFFPPGSAASWAGYSLRIVKGTAKVAGRIISWDE